MSYRRRFAAVLAAAILSAIAFIATLMESP